MKRVKDMTYEELADETALLRAQVKVLQNWIALHKASLKQEQLSRMPDTWETGGGRHWDR